MFFSFCVKKFQWFKTGQNGGIDMFSPHGNCLYNLVMQTVFDLDTKKRAKRWGCVSGLALRANCFIAIIFFAAHVHLSSQDLAFTTFFFSSFFHPLKNELK